jgi:glycosyltransferase involved in cell wall biosynthesis
MRICLVTPELPPYRHGGIGTYVRILAEGYGRRGHEVTVVGPRLHTEPVVTHEWGQSVSVDFQPRFFWRLTRLGRRHIAWGSLRGAVAVRRFLASQSPFDIVESSNFPGYAAFVPSAATRYVVRCSTSARDTSWDGGRMAAHLEALSCRRADLVIANSEASADKARHDYSYRGPLRIIPHGMPDVPAVGQPGTEDLCLLFVGRAEDRKGTDLLIMALANLLPRHPNVVFRTVGADFDTYAASRGPLATVWANLTASCPRQIEQLGSVDEPTKLRALAEAHWVVLPSRYESFGLVVVEAMRAGTPVVAAAAGGLREVSATFSGNRLCVPGDAVALERCLSDIVELGPEHARALRPGARGAYLRWFQADQMIDQSLRYYEDLLASRLTGSCGTVSRAHRDGYQESDGCPWYLQPSRASEPRSGTDQLLCAHSHDVRRSR